MSTLGVSDECADKQAVRTVLSARTIFGSVGSRSESLLRRLGSKNTTNPAANRIGKSTTTVTSQDIDEMEAAAQSSQEDFEVHFV